MTDTLLSRIKRQEQKAQVSELPSPVEEIAIIQALVFPNYTESSKLLKEHKQVLNEWKEKLGEQVFSTYKNKLLKRIKLNKPEVTMNQATVERIKQLRESEENKFS